MRSPFAEIERLESELAEQGVACVGGELLTRSVGSQDLRMRRKRYLRALAAETLTWGREVGASLAFADSTALGQGKTALWFLMDEYREILRSSQAIAIERSKNRAKSPFKTTRLYAFDSNVSPVDAHCLLYLLQWHHTRGIRTGVVPFERLPGEAKQGIVVVPTKRVTLIRNLESGDECDMLVEEDPRRVQFYLDLYEETITKQGLILGDGGTLDDIGIELGLDRPYEQDSKKLCLFGFLSRENKRYPVLIDQSARFLRPGSYLTLLKLIKARLVDRFGDGWIGTNELTDPGQQTRKRSTRYHPAHGKLRYLREDLGTFRDVVENSGKQARLAIGSSYVTMFRARLPALPDSSVN